MKKVLAHGSFDILHDGHVRYLTYAKSLGDYLIVALSSDYIIKLHKGDKRPINPFEQRKELLLALAVVDEVIETPHDTDDHAENLFNAMWEIRPNIFVSSYNNIEPQQQLIMTDLGVSCVQAPRFSGVSTTSIIDKIIKAYR